MSSPTFQQNKTKLGAKKKKKRIPVSLHIYFSTADSFYFSAPGLPSVVPRFKWFLTKKHNLNDFQKAPFNKVTWKTLIILFEQSKYLCDCFRSIHTKEMIHFFLLKVFQHIHLVLQFLYHFNNSFKLSAPSGHFGTDFWYCNILYRDN